MDQPKLTKGLKLGLLFHWKTFDHIPALLFFFCYLFIWEEGLFIEKGGSSGKSRGKGGPALS